MMRSVMMFYDFEKFPGGACLVDSCLWQLHLCYNNLDLETPN